MRCGSESGVTAQLDEILDERLSGNASPEASPEASPWDASTSTPARRDRPGDDLYESFHEASVFEEQRFDSPAADLLRPAADFHEADPLQQRERWVDACATRGMGRRMRRSNAMGRLPTQGATGATVA